ncbi:MAG TPA: ATP-binding cassette domain-containing protein [Planctomycetota bacterium]|jgi:ABC-2 type transport system ATP-binding protein|nr:ATP-binding cassette domain-containing protein [Planctomycetota bacterium]
MIRVQGLTKRYGPVVALEEVSFEIGRGEVVGFLGPNGAGKTTTMKILTGYLYPDRGGAEVAGHSVLREPLAVKRQIGYLPENTPLYAEMRVDHYLDFAGAVRGMPRGERRGAIERVAGTCALEGVLKKAVGELSRGYRQRVGLAQALLHDPPILVLDEPTSGLDPNQIVEIRGLIARLGREKTILLSTHILPEVRDTCRRVLILHRGRIVADGSPESLAAGEAGEVALFVTLRGANGAQALLASLPGVRGVDPLGKEDGRERFRVLVPSGEAVEERIFDATVARGWKLLELRRETKTLEDVFRRLTTEG